LKLPTTQPFSVIAALESIQKITNIVEKGQLEKLSYELGNEQLGVRGEVWEFAMPLYLYELQMHLQMTQVKI